MPVCQPSNVFDEIAAAKIDIVVSDIMMPGITGFEILRFLKETDPLVEVILLTGELPDKAKPALNAVRSGAFDYLLKPVSMSELKSTIQMALANQRRHMEDREKLYELTRRANTDYLTGLSNRHHFEIQAKREFERSDRYQRSLTCIVFDIDGFKSINDSFGHRVGDMVLQKLGELLRIHFRASDLKCRFGGEEFVLIMPETNEDVAPNVAEKLRRLVAKESFPLEDVQFRVTVSVGVATLVRKNFPSLEELIHGADLALLKAKSEGRNCVRCADPSMRRRQPQTTLP